MKTITITHDDYTELTANEYQDCLECNAEDNLSKLRIGFEEGNHEYAFVECPHCENETIIPTY